MKVAIVGATGLVGRKMIQVLEERNFPAFLLWLPKNQQEKKYRSNNRKLRLYPLKKP